MKAYTFFTLFFLIPGALFSQAGKKYPVSFPLFFRAYPLVNPASSGSEKAFMDFRLGDLGNTGPFKEIRTIYANGSLRINKKNDRYKHVIGGTLYNDQEGNPIHRARCYGNYALHVRLGTTSYLSSGISLGLVNYAFNGSTSLSTGSAINYDGSAGLWFYSNNYHIGISLNQIFNRKLVPIREVFTLAPYFTVTASRRIQVNETLFFQPHFILNYYSANYYQGDLILLAGIGKYLTAGAGYRYQRGMVWVAGISNIPVFKNKLEFYFSYSTPFINASNTNINSYQISLNYYFLKKQKTLEPEQEEESY